eukprot:4662771-Alexandrium_andersonii.AAC.1
MIRRPPRSTHCVSSAASDVYKRQVRRPDSQALLVATQPQGGTVHGSLLSLIHISEPTRLALI